MQRDSGAFVAAPCIPRQVPYAQRREQEQQEDRQEDSELAPLASVGPPPPPRPIPARVRCLLGLCAVLLIAFFWSSANPPPAPDRARSTHTPPEGDNAPQAAQPWLSVHGATDSDPDVARAEVTSNDTLNQLALACNQSRFSLAQHTRGTLAYNITRADCGLGYDFAASPARRAPWRVVLYGLGWHGETLEYSGCPVGPGRCPWSKHCTIVVNTEPASHAHADVVVVFQKAAEFITHARRRATGNDTLAKPHRVLYWREALWPSADLRLQRDVFDFEMGVHHFSGILNPLFMRGPTLMMHGAVAPLGNIPFLAFARRTNFAMSVISDCRTPSFRQIYIDHLVAFLGHDKVHQYGKCGNRHLPGKPIERAAKIISTYKFYLAFENTIMEGYVTEKLTSVLMMNVIPIYYGTPDAPNITKQASYIRASDFRTPQALGEYLLHLNEHPEEYMRYHAWRNDASQFDAEFLDTMARRAPGPAELEPYLHFKHYPRTAACCRLCDENYVRQARLDRAEDHLVGGRWGFGRINEKFFDGKLRRG